MYLTGIEVQNAKGTYTPVWEGAIPLKVQNRGVVLTGATVGASANYDLCAVYRETSPGSPRLLQLQPAIVPSNVSVQTEQEYHARLTLQARSVEIDSESLIVTIDWNGEWHNEAGQMAIDLVASALDS
ncbi:MAG: hypothetical protein WBE48_10930 [Xanthobacteraceae bacterium]